MPDLSPEILASLKNIEAWSILQRKWAKWSLISVIPIVLITVALPLFITRQMRESFDTIPERTERNWYDVTSAVRKNELDKALALADELLERNPRDFDGYYRRGEILVMLDKQTEALESFRQAARIFPLPKYKAAVEALTKSAPKRRAMPIPTP